MTAADANQNTFLAQNEFVDFVHRLTYGAVDAPFANLGATLQAVYSSRVEGIELPITGASPTTVASPSQQSFLNSLCADTILGLLEALTIVVDIPKCFLFMSIGDALDRNNLLTREEFPRYANALSQNLYGSVAFDGLPLPIQLVFDDFADPSTDAIDITGTRPGTQPSVDREAILSSLCRQSLVAIEAGKNDDLPPPTEDSPEALAPTFRFCKTAMTAADMSRDQQMDTGDYARFVNILSGNGYPSKDYELLPELLKTNFIEHSNDSGVVNISGSRPGTPSITEEQASLEAFCDTTVSVLNELIGASEESTLAPTPGEVTAYPYTQCTLSMATSDLDRSNILSTTEYVSFLNKMESFAWKDIAYADLPLALKINFEELSSATGHVGINISGSFPGTLPTEAEREFLERICFDTALAADAALYPNKYGELGNTTFSGNVTVYSAFLLSTSSETTIEELFTTNNTFYTNALATAYGSFVQNAVGVYQSSSPRFAKYSVVGNSEELYSFEDAVCEPMTGNLTPCQVAYASFELDVRREPNITFLEDDVTQAIQFRMKDTEYGLQSFVDLALPNSSFIIVGVPKDGRVRPATDSPTVVVSESQPSDGGLSTGIKILIILAGALLCVGGYLAYIYGDIPERIQAARKARPKLNQESNDDAGAVPAGFAEDQDVEQPVDFSRKENRQREQDNSDHDFGFDDFRRRPAPDDDEETFRRRRRASSEEERSASEENSGYGDSDSGSDKRSGPQRGRDREESDYGSDYGSDDSW